MLPSTSWPVESAGIWPETKIWPLARMAWDCWVLIGVFGLLLIAGWVCWVLIVLGLSHSGGWGKGGSRGLIGPVEV